jgi:cation diffusion facilitator family transporter
LGRQDGEGLSTVFRRLNLFIVRKYIPHYQEVQQPQVRRRYGVLEGWVGILGNLLLFAVKLGAGIRINSVSLIADAVHTLTDVITSGIVVISFNVAQKPGDRQHPYGHGRVEYIATLVIALLLFLASHEFLKTSLNRLVAPSPVRYNLGVFTILMLSAVSKEWMFSFARDLGNMVQSSALIADAWHHRSDAIASFCIGLGLLGVLAGFPRIDGVLGILVSLLIAYTAYDLGRGSVNKLLGEGPPEALVKEIKECALEVEGVKDIHDIEVHDYGDSKHISAHIGVDPALDVKQAHHITDQVSQKIESRLNAVIHLHVDPVPSPLETDPAGLFRQICFQTGKRAGLNQRDLLGACQRWRGYSFSFSQDGGSEHQNDSYHHQDHNAPDPKFAFRVQ